MKTILLRFRQWLRRKRVCEPNVLIGYADPLDRMKTICRVESWMCGDALCRCGGTRQRGFLDLGKEPV